MRWTAVTDQKYEDIRYDHSDGIARITINRPEVRNAFRPETVKELIHAFTHAQLDPDIGVIQDLLRLPDHLHLFRRVAKVFG